MDQGQGQYIFLVSGETPERWFQTLQEGIVYALARGLVLERIHLKADGTVSRMILTDLNSDQ